MELLGTPRTNLLLTDANGDEKPPSAIRASWWRYTFASWPELRQGGQWWRRERIPGADQPRIWQRDLDAYTVDRFVPRSSPWWRQWALLGAVVVAHASGTRLWLSLCGGREAQSLTRRVLKWLASTMAAVMAFTYALFMDYPDNSVWKFLSGRGATHAVEL